MHSASKFKIAGTLEVSFTRNPRNCSKHELAWLLCRLCHSTTLPIYFGLFVRKTHWNVGSLLRVENTCRVSILIPHLSWGKPQPLLEFVPLKQPAGSAQRDSEELGGIDVKILRGELTQPKANAQTVQLVVEDALRVAC